MRTPRAILSLLLLSLAAAPAGAERLPVRSYATADGLAHDRVEQIFRDSRGFMWFCTMDGLSRFDGYEFKNYGTGEGLTSSRTSDIAETRDGSYWVATYDGVGRFDTAPRARPNGAGGSAFFTHYAVGDSPSSNRVNDLYVDASGRLWAGTAAGLFVYFADGGAGEFRRVELNAGGRPDEMLEVNDIARDAEGSLWIATEHGLVRRTAEGRATRYDAPAEKSEGGLWAVLTDDRGRVWAGGGAGLLVFKPSESYGLDAGRRLDAGLPEVAGEWRRLTAADGLGVDDVRSLFRSHDGHVWVGTRGGGLSEIDESGRVRSFGAANGLSEVVLALSEDCEGHIWAGTPADGALKLSRRGLTSYGEADGLGSTEVVSIFEGGAGEVYVVTSGLYVNRYDGGRFVAVRPRLPPRLLGPVKHLDPVIRDHAGDWWAATAEGVFRFPAVNRLEELARTPPVKVYTRSEGLADSNVNRIYEDARGDIWLGSYTPPLVLTRWERSTDTFHVYSAADGIPEQNFANAFASDADGTLWVGLHNGGVMRYRGGRFESFGAEAGIPGGIVLGLYADRARRLWVGTSGGGAARLDDTTSGRPRFVTVTKGDGLSSNMMRAFAEGGAGEFYVGTARGVDRFGAGRVVHFTTDDGLPTGEVTAALRDSRGSLWFGTRGGLARLDPPAPEQPLEAPPVFVSAVRVAGVAQPVPEVGAAEVGGLALDYAQRQLQVEFVGPGFGAGGRLRYQYMLEGLDREWGAPTEQRSVSYAHLAPGSYRFLVRAVTADGAAGGHAAVVAFRVVPPVWMRWWFVSLVALCLAALALAWWRLRRARRAERERAEAELRRAKEERLAELERVRKRIATDLHDDIGSSLTQIAVLSEVARATAGAGSEQLAQITAVSNELVESMSDIVWAINPKKDRLSDLTQRMRRFASDVFTARGVRFHFEAPPVSAADGDVRLGADLRREVFLIFKESVNNAVKHSGAARAEVEFRLEGGELLLRVTDDGRGFDATVAERSGEYERTVGGRGGNGLRSLYKRAHELGGTYEVCSAPGAGTTVSLRVPLRRNHPNGW